METEVRMNSLAQHNSDMERLAAQLQAFLDIAGRLGAGPILDRIERSIEKLRSESFTIAVVGEFSTGKSTLINALIGRNLLPVAAKICTAVPTTIREAREGEDAGIQGTRGNGTLVELHKEELVRFLCFDSEDFDDSELSAAEVRLKDVEWLSQGLMIVDTPGINDEGLRGERVTLEFLPKADAIVFLTKADQALKDSEVKFLKTRVLEADLHRMVIVVNAIDRADEDDLPELRERINLVVERISPEAPVHFVSARNYCRNHGGKSKELVDSSGILTLVKELERLLVRHRGQERITREARILEYYRGELRRMLQVKIESINLDAGLRERRENRLKERLTLLPEDANRLRETVVLEFSALRRRCGAACDPRLASFEDALGQLSPADEGSSSAIDLVKGCISECAALIQSCLRGYLPEVHRRVARQVGQYFSSIEAQFDEGEVSLSLHELEWSEMVESMGRSSGTPGSSSSRELAVAGAEVGGILGILALSAFGVIGLPAAVLAMGFGVAAARIGSNVARISRTANSDSKAILKRVRKEVEDAARFAISELEKRTNAELDALLRGKEEELRDRLAKLRESRRDDLNTEAERKEYRTLLARLCGNEQPEAGS